MYSRARKGFAVIYKCINKYILYDGGGGGARPALQRYSFDSFYTYTHTWYPSPLLLKGQTSEIEMGQKRGLNIGWRPSKTWYGWRLQKG